MTDSFDDLFGSVRGSGRPDPEPETPDLGETPCINREFRGGVEDITYADFAEFVIQDDDTAQEVAGRMLGGDDPYEWNEDETEFYERFSVTDADALRFQLDKAAE